MKDAEDRIGLAEALAIIARGPALVLLTVIARQPRAVLQALSRCGFPVKPAAASTLAEVSSGFHAKGEQP